MRNCLIAVTILILGVSLPAPLQAQNFGSGKVKSVAAGGTPVVPDKLVNDPVPHLPDGHPDVTGPWVYGGSNEDIEIEGGLKPGELPLLPDRKSGVEGKRG